jgi:hypothetical protein
MTLAVLLRLLRTCAYPQNLDNCRCPGLHRKPEPCHASSKLRLNARRLRRRRRAGQRTPSERVVSRDAPVGPRKNFDRHMRTGSATFIMASHATCFNSGGTRPAAISPFLVGSRRKNGRTALLGRIIALWANGNVPLIVHGEHYASLIDVGETVLDRIRDVLVSALPSCQAARPRMDAVNACAFRSGPDRSGTSIRSALSTPEPADLPMRVFEE